MAEPGITAPRKRPTTFTVSPGACRAAEHEHKDMLENSAKIQAFFKYFKFEDSQKMDRCLGRVGKSPNCLGSAPDGGPKSLHSSLVTGRERNKHMKRNRDLRLAKIEVLRKEIATLTDTEIMERLEETFSHYCDKEMAIIGWIRLLRDCRILDHRVTLVVADVLFTQVEGGADASSIQGDLHLDYDEFLTCLRRLIAVKFPSRAQTPKAVDATLLLLARKWLLPFQRPTLQLRGVDGLFSRECLNLMRTHDAQVKRLFAWYSSLNETDPKRVTWEGVRYRPATLGSAEFALMLLNFEVLPDLLSKHEAVDVFMECEEENDADEQAEAMLLPAFMETLAMVALRVGDAMNRRIRDAASPDEMKALKRYIDQCPTILRQQLLVTYRSVMRERGREDVDMKTLIAAVRVEPSDLYDLAGEASREREGLLGRQRLWQEQIAVVMRREELRQRFAEARLRNFYRDVRTSLNNSTWPPGPPDLGKGEEPRWEAPENRYSDAAEQQVAFYSDQRQIKTPQPKWLPSTNHHLTSRVEPFALTQNDGSPRDQAPSTTHGSPSPKLAYPTRATSSHAHDISLTAAALLDLHQKGLLPRHSGTNEYSSQPDSGHASYTGGGGMLLRDLPSQRSAQPMKRSGAGSGDDSTDRDAGQDASPLKGRAGGNGSGGGTEIGANRWRGGEPPWESGGGGSTNRSNRTLNLPGGIGCVKPINIGSFNEQVRNSMFSRGTPSAGGNGNWAMPSPKSYQMKVMIEEMDESEMIMEFSKRLPTLRLQHKGASGEGERAYTAFAARGDSPPRSVQELRGMLTGRAITAPVPGIRPMLSRLLSAPSNEGNLSARKSRAMPISFGGGVLFGEGRSYGSSIGCQQQH